MRNLQATQYGRGDHRFLSIQAQDFIEDSVASGGSGTLMRFLSIQAQDFIEERGMCELPYRLAARFLSIQAQDFIEELS